MKLPDEIAAKIKRPRGTRDLMNEDLRYFDFILGKAKERFEQSGFHKIETPLFEHVEVFDRSIGKETDVVSKEMYDFFDKGENHVSLRPESTAGVCRAYLENKMYAGTLPVELWYAGPHFRYDRPQKGRYRQFYQLGAEVIGESNPAIDAQVILLCRNILKDIGLLDSVTLQINTIGSREGREAYCQKLTEYYAGKDRSMCDNCLRRRETNPLRLLDCKNEDCVILADMAPKMIDSLSQEDKDFYKEVKEFLDALGVEYVENPKLVRGLDYYAHTVFEFWNGSEGAQNSLGGGGRYDYLIEQFGGQATPAIGFAFGLDRLVNEMEDQDIEVPTGETTDVFVAGLGQEAKKQSLVLIDKMHDVGIHCVGAMGKPAMNHQLKLADSLKVQYALILGELEVNEGVVLVRDMKKGAQEKIPQEEIVEFMLKKLGNE